MMGPERVERERTLSASELRKANKPVMEKRRRARINESLTQLKSLVLDALKRDTSRYSKLEKADILEMTVKHLRTVQRSQMAAAMVSDTTVVGKYRAGFAECATEVMRYLSTIDGLAPDVRSRLINHMVDCLHKVSAPPVASQTYRYPQPTPNATPLASMPGAFPNVPESKMPSNASFHVIPTALPNGQVLFVPSYAVAGTVPPTTVSSPEQCDMSNRTSLSPQPADGTLLSVSHRTPEVTCTESSPPRLTSSPIAPEYRQVNTAPLCHSTPHNHKSVRMATFPCTSPDSASCSSDSFTWSPPAKHVSPPTRQTPSPVDGNMNRTGSNNNIPTLDNKENEVYLYVASEEHDLNNNVVSRTISKPFQFDTVQVKVEPAPAPAPAPAPPAMQQYAVEDRSMWRPW